MALVKKEFVFKIMEDKDLPYFILTDGRNMIDENQDTGITAEAIRQLEETLEAIEDSTVVIKLSNKNKKDKAKGGKDYENYEYRINLKQANAGMTGTGINGTVLGMMEKNNELQRRLDLLEKESELKELRREIAEIKAGGNDQVDKWLPILSSFLTKDTGAAMKQNVGVAGHEEETINESFIEAQKKTRLALIKLAKVDKNLPDTLTLLADFAERKPNEYLALLPVLKTR